MRCVTLSYGLTLATTNLVMDQNGKPGKYYFHFSLNSVSFFRANKAHSIYNELPVVTRCHTYLIHSKFVYRCNKCGQELVFVYMYAYSKYLCRIRRHSKSLDTQRKICGRCHGRFELFVQGNGGTERRHEQNEQQQEQHTDGVKQLVCEYLSMCVTV
jgi:hypothetical protein